MRLSDRLAAESGIFTELALKKAALFKQGIEVIDLSVGAPDLPAARHIMDALIEGVSDESQYVYAIKDKSSLLEAASGWYKRRFSVDLDPESEITSVMGSQEGLAHIAMACLSPGDVVLCPDPGYPIFSMGPKLCGATVVPVPLLPENNYLIDFDAIPAELANSAKLIIVSYPNNPTAATAPKWFYERLVEFAVKHDICVVHDNAYCELTFDGQICGSFLETPGAKEVGIEFNSLSKTYNMAGCRIGFALGNAEVISRLRLLKSHIDYGIFLPIQKAAETALNGPQFQVAETRETYRRRRDILVDGLCDAGWIIPSPPATMFVWAPVPPWFSGNSALFAQSLMELGIVVVPGTAFGEHGEGFVRFALVQPERLMQEAVSRICESLFIKNR